MTKVHLETVFRSFAVAMKRTFAGDIEVCFLTTNLAQVKRNSKVMIHKGGVLLRVQHLIITRVGRGIYP